MYVAFGLTTGKIYARSKHRAGCFRKLQSKYPTLDYGKTKKGNAVIQLYPERLRIERYV